jgi:hypothetical protein
MSKSYVIQWKSKLNGRAGKGTKVFDWDEATGLAQELNGEYPDIQHEVIEASIMETPSTMEREPVNEATAGAEAPQTNHSPDHAFSFE